MDSITTSNTLQAEVREFAREFPTPNVKRAVALAEAGRLSWEQVHGVLKGALATGLQEVAA